MPVDEITKKKLEVEAKINKLLEELKPKAFAIAFMMDFGVEGSHSNFYKGEGNPEDVILLVEKLRDASLEEAGI